MDHWDSPLKVSEIWSTLASSAVFLFLGELVQILFRCFDYMLKHCLDTLKIEEVSCVQ